ncbi:hypothetical protein EPN52_12625 [bacterium]|nr:MAG: hypothetical protein EPN52_12625 [bacterium]
MSFSVFARSLSVRRRMRAMFAEPERQRADRYDRASTWAERPSYEPPAKSRLYLWVPHIR